MKKAGVLFFICLIAYYQLQAQTENPAIEQFNSFQQMIYIDNLAQELMPDIFLNSYYYKTNKADFVVSQTIDTLLRRREIHIYSKKANNGFLFVNDFIMNSITTIDYEEGNLLLRYVYSNKEVSSEKDVRRFIRLRKKHIRISDITFDRNLGLLTIYIIGERKNKVVDLKKGFHNNLRDY